MYMIQEADTLVFYPERDGAYCIYQEVGNNILIQGTGTIKLKKPDMHEIYRVEFSDEIGYVSPTLLPDTGILNFRDLGGIRNTENQQVRYRCFYRSAPISFRTPAQKAYIENLRIKTNLDFRSDVEAANEPDQMLDGCEYIRVSAMQIEGSAFHGDFDFSQLLKSGRLDALREYLKDSYKTMPFNNEAYKVMFTRLLQNETPIVFHCSAGKDRTGVGAYLILKTLGVSDDVIMKDYLSSNIYRKEENEKLSAAAGEHSALVESLMMVQESYLQATMDAIQERYGDFETYLKNEYAIGEKEISLLKNRYLYTS